MKGISILLAPCLVILSLSSARAQTLVALPPAATPRPDIAGSVGWLNVNKSELGNGNDWYNHSAQGALIFGWYWSPHIKTELEVSASSEAEFYAASEQFINGTRVFAASEYGFSTKRVTVGGRLSGGAITVAIQDTGIGIEKEALKKLGRPFEQVESQLTKSHQGSGLGLAIAKSLVELHGGAMRIRSAPGKGTLVVVRLPRATPFARPDETGVSPEQPLARWEQSAKHAC